MEYRRQRRRTGNMGRRAVIAGAALAALGFVTGCRARRARLPAPPAMVAPGEEVGIASWYGHPYHGRRTASGEVYDMELLTAAHRTRPFDTWVRVRNLDNGMWVDVRINDRGPFVDGRVIDLSRAAAREIDMIGPGTAWVRVEPANAPPGAARPCVPPAASCSPPPAAKAPAAAPTPAVPQEPVPAESPPGSEATPGRFAVQVGAFELFDNAERLRVEMEAAFGAARLVVRDGTPPVWRVLVGDEAGMAEAEALALRIRAGHGNAFVVRLDSR
jgi:rare lipoprotein A